MHGVISACVDVDLHDLIEHDAVWFLDQLRDGGHGASPLDDFFYDLVGFSGNTLHIAVHGDTGPCPDREEA